jgi:hypothetical protein
MVSAALTAALLIAAPAAMATGGKGRGDPEIVIAWNALLQQTAPPTLGLQGPRYYSMLHIAMFDAVNSIERDYTKFHTRVWSSRGASTDAAAAQAAHDVLSYLIPASKPAYDAALASQLANIPPGRAAQGVAVGAQVAARIIAWRANDGWAIPPPPYVLPLLPGNWQPTPPANAPPGAMQLRYTEPFALLTPSQYQPGRFPEINSAVYAEDFNEVKGIGAAGSATRTAEETTTALIWAGQGYGPNLFALWNRVARDVARGAGMSLIETARLFALVNVSLNDGLQTSQASKFVYGLWRPITAIRQADLDLNPATDPETGWSPLLAATPPYPSYPGNMACIGAAVATALGLGVGTDAFSFSIEWTGLPPAGGGAAPPNVTRNYTSFWQAGTEEARSRVLGGIHFTFDNEASQEACPKVAHWVNDNYMVPRRH